MFITQRSRYSFFLQNSQDLANFLFQVSLSLLSLVEFLFKSNQSTLDFGFFVSNLALSFVELLFKGNLLLLSLVEFLFKGSQFALDLLAHRIEMRIELLFESFVLNDVSLGRLFSLLSDAVQSFLKLSLKLRNPLLSYFTHLTDGAFPIAELIVFVVIWGHNEKEPLNFLVNFAIFRRSLMNIGCEVAE